MSYENEKQKWETFVELALEETRSGWFTGAPTVDLAWSPPDGSGLIAQDDLVQAQSLLDKLNFIAQNSQQFLEDTSDGFLGFAEGPLCPTCDPNKDDVDFFKKILAPKVATYVEDLKIALANKLLYRDEYYLKSLFALGDADDVLEFVGIYNNAITAAIDFLDETKYGGITTRREIKPPPFTNLLGPETIQDDADLESSMAFNSAATSNHYIGLNLAPGKSGGRRNRPYVPVRTSPSKGDPQNETVTEVGWDDPDFYLIDSSGNFVRPKEGDNNYESDGVEFPIGTRIHVTEVVHSETGIWVGFLVDEGEISDTDIDPIPLFGEPNQKKITRSKLSQITNKFTRPLYTKSQYVRRLVGAQLADPLVSKRVNYKKHGVGEPELENPFIELPDGTSLISDSNLKWKGLDPLDVRMAYFNFAKTNEGTKYEAKNLQSKPTLRYSEGYFYFIVGDGARKDTAQLQEELEVAEPNIDIGSDSYKEKLEQTKGEAKNETIVQIRDKAFDDLLKYLNKSLDTPKGDGTLYKSLKEEYFIPVETNLATAGPNPNNQKVLFAIPVSYIDAFPDSKKLYGRNFSEESEFSTGRNYAFSMRLKEVRPAVDSLVKIFEDIKTRHDAHKQTGGVIKNPNDIDWDPQQQIENLKKFPTLLDDFLARQAFPVATDKESLALRYVSQGTHVDSTPDHLIQIGLKDNNKDGGDVRQTISYILYSPDMLTPSPGSDLGSVEKTLFDLQHLDPYIDPEQLKRSGFEATQALNWFRSKFEGIQGSRTLHYLMMYKNIVDVFGKSIPKEDAKDKWLDFLQSYTVPPLKIYTSRDRRFDEEKIDCKEILEQLRFTGSVISGEQKKLYDILANNPKCKEAFYEEWGKPTPATDPESTKKALQQKSDQLEVASKNAGSSGAFKIFYGSVLHGLDPASLMALLMACLQHKLGVKLTAAALCEEAIIKLIELRGVSQIRKDILDIFPHLAPMLGDPSFLLDEESNAIIDKYSDGSILKEEDLSYVVSGNKLNPLFKDAPTATALAISEKYDSSIVEAILQIERQGVDIQLKTSSNFDELSIEDHKQRIKDAGYSDGEINANLIIQGMLEPVESQYEYYLQSPGQAGISDESRLASSINVDRELPNSETEEEKSSRRKAAEEFYRKLIDAGLDLGQICEALVGPLLQLMRGVGKMDLGDWSTNYWDNLKRILNPRTLIPTMKFADQLTTDKLIGNYGRLLLHATLNMIGLMLGQILSVIIKDALQKCFEEDDIGPSGRSITPETVPIPTLAAAMRDTGLPIEEFLNPTNDLFDKLSPGQLCALLQGDATEKTLKDVFAHFSAYPELSSVFESVDDVATVFLQMGEALPNLDICNVIQGVDPIDLGDCNLPDYEYDIRCKELMSQGLTEEECDAQIKKEIEDLENTVKDMASLLFNSDAGGGNVLDGVLPEPCGPQGFFQLPEAIQDSVERVTDNILTFAKGSLMEDLRSLRFFSMPPRALLTVSDPEEMREAHKMFTDAVSDPYIKQCVAYVCGNAGPTSQHFKTPLNETYNLTYGKYFHYGYDRNDPDDNHAASESANMPGFASDQLDVRFEHAASQSSTKNAGRYFSTIKPLTIESVYNLYDANHKKQKVPSDIKKAAGLLKDLYLQTPAAEGGYGLQEDEQLPDDAQVDTEEVSAFLVKQFGEIIKPMFGTGDDRYGLDAFVYTPDIVFRLDRKLGYSNDSKMYEYLPVSPWRNKSGETSFKDDSGAIQAKNKNHYGMQEAWLHKVYPLDTKLIDIHQNPLYWLPMCQMYLGAFIDEETKTLERGSGTPEHLDSWRGVKAAADRLLQVRSTQSLSEDTTLVERFMELTVAEATGLEKSRIEKMFPEFSNFSAIKGVIFGLGINRLHLVDTDPASTEDGIRHVLDGAAHSSATVFYNTTGICPIMVMFEEGFRDPNNILNKDADELTSHFSMENKKVNPELYDSLQMPEIYPPSFGYSPGVANAYEDQLLLEDKANFNPNVIMYDLPFTEIQPKEVAGINASQQRDQMLELFTNGMDTVDSDIISITDQLQWLQQDHKLVYQNMLSDFDGHREWQESDIYDTYTLIKSKLKQTSYSSAQGEVGSLPPDPIRDGASTLDRPLYNYLHAKKLDDDIQDLLKEIGMSSTDEILDNWQSISDVFGDLVSVHQDVAGTDYLRLDTLPGNAYNLVKSNFKAQIFGKLLTHKYRKFAEKYNSSPPEVFDKRLEFILSRYGYSALQYAYSNQMLSKLSQSRLHERKFMKKLWKKILRNPLNKSKVDPRCRQVFDELGVVPRKDLENVETDFFNLKEVKPKIIKFYKKSVCRDVYEDVAQEENAVKKSLIEGVIMLLVKVYCLEMCLASLISWDSIDVSEVFKDSAIAGIIIRNIREDIPEIGLLAEYVNDIIRKEEGITDYESFLLRTKTSGLEYLISKEGENIASVIKGIFSNSSPLSTDLQLNIVRTSDPDFLKKNEKRLAEAQADEDSWKTSLKTGWDPYLGGYDYVVDVHFNQNIYTMNYGSGKRGGYYTIGDSNLEDAVHAHGDPYLQSMRLDSDSTWSEVYENPSDLFGMNSKNNQKNYMYSLPLNYHPRPWSAAPHWSQKAGKDFSATRYDDYSSTDGFDPFIVGSPTAEDVEEASEAMEHVGWNNFKELLLHHDRQPFSWDTPNKTLRDEIIDNRPDSWGSPRELAKQDRVFQEKYLGHFLPSSKENFLDGTIRNSLNEKLGNIIIQPYVYIVDSTSVDREKLDVKVYQQVGPDGEPCDDPVLQHEFTVDSVLGPDPIHAEWRSGNNFYNAHVYDYVPFSVWNHYYRHVFLKDIYSDPDKKLIFLEHGLYPFFKEIRFGLRMSYITSRPIADVQDDGFNFWPTLHSWLSLDAIKRGKTFVNQAPYLNTTKESHDNFSGKSVLREIHIPIIETEHTLSFLDEQGIPLARSFNVDGKNYSLNELGRLPGAHDLGGYTGGAGPRIDNVPPVDASAEKVHEWLLSNPKIVQSYVNSADQFYYKNLAKVQLENLKATPEFRLLFENLFPMRRYMTLAFLYAGDGLSKFIPEPTDILDETKYSLLLTLKSLLESSDYKFVPDPIKQTLEELAIAGDMGVDTNVPNLRKQILRILIMTPLHILKGFVEITDPAVMIAKLVVDIATAISESVIAALEQSVALSEQTINNTIMKVENAKRQIEMQLSAGAIPIQMAIDNLPGELKPDPAKQQPGIATVNIVGSAVKDWEIIIHPECADAEGDAPCYNFPSSEILGDIDVTELKTTIDSIKEDVEALEQMKKDYLKLDEDLENTKQELQDTIVVMKRKIKNTKRKIKNTLGSPYMIPGLWAGMLPTWMPFGGGMPPVNPLFITGVGPPSTIPGMIYIALLLIGVYEEQQDDAMDTGADEDNPNCEDEL